jgi:ribonuclease-3
LAGKRPLVAHPADGALSLAKRPDNSLRQLSDRLGYAFKDKYLLKLALTHSSTRAVARKPLDDNERLEFLGDRVLGLAVAELLISRFPDAPEGELALYFNHLVRAETCFEVAIDWDLGRLIAVGGGAAGNSMLGNACEAVLGAIFADGGYECARDVVHSFWERYLSDLELAAPNAKSVLQEWAQGKGLPLPRYLEVAREGPDHAPRFTTEVHIEGIAPIRAQGANKRAAEQAAAYAMLLREGVWQEPPHG